MQPAMGKISPTSFGSIKNVGHYQEAYHGFRTLFKKGFFAPTKLSPGLKAIRGVKSREPHSNAIAQSKIFDASLLNGVAPFNRFTDSRIPLLKDSDGGKRSKKDAGHYCALTIHAHLSERFKYGVVPYNDFMITGLPMDHFEVGQTLYVFRIEKLVTTFDIMSDENRLALESLAQDGALAKILAGRSVLERLLDKDDHTWPRAFHDAMVDSKESEDIEAINWESAQADISGLPDSTNIVLLGEPNQRLLELVPEKIIRVSQGPQFYPIVEEKPIDITYNELLD